MTFLFVDSNVFLSFFHYSSDDVEQLDKLAFLIEHKEIVLYLPQQVLNEVERNRSAKIREPFESLKKAKYSTSFPAYCKDYEIYTELKAVLAKAEELKAGLVACVESDIGNRQLAADKLIARIFSAAEVRDADEPVFAAVDRRRTIGNPPGKDGSFGDAIIWETLLAKTIKAQFDLHFVSDDRDWYDVIDDKLFLPALQSEWSAAKKGGRIVAYRSMSQYLKANYPKIVLSDERRKDGLILALATAGSFAKVHSVIGQLTKYSAFTSKQVEDLIEAAVLNDQILWILSDDDVFQFFVALRNQYELPFTFDANGQKLEKLLTEIDPTI